MKNLLGIIVCFLVSKYLFDVEVLNSLTLKLIINFFALIIRYLGITWFAILQMYDMEQKQSFK